MATTIFLILNVMGLAFLLYVLVNFWKEGTRTTADVRPAEFDFMQEERRAVLVVTHLIAHNTSTGQMAITLNAREQRLARKRTERETAGAIYEMEIKRFSVR